MELLIIIVQEVDYGRLSREFIKHKILATKFTTEGLYLNKKSITLMVCIEKEREEESWNISGRAVRNVWRKSWYPNSTDRCSWTWSKVSKSEGQPCLPLMWIR